MCDMKGETDTAVFQTATKLVAVALATGVIDYFEEFVSDRKKKYRKSIERARKKTAMVSRSQALDLYKCVHSVQKILRHHSDNDTGVGKRKNTMGSFACELAALLLAVWLPCVKSYLTLNSTPVTWLEAQRRCNENGGMLVTEFEPTHVKNLIKDSGVGVIQLWKGQYLTPWVWLKGCFQFDGFDGFNTNFTLKFNQMSECIKYCSKTNYFGLHNTTCFCFDSLVGNSVQTDEDCTLPCPGNTRERCGGNASLSVYMNDICYNSSRDWNGTISRTITGNECLPWKSINSVATDINLKFPDDSLVDASNYCRDPNGTAELWCYTRHNQTERCDVPLCIPDNNKQGDTKCMSAFKHRDTLYFEGKRCTSNLKAVCLGVDNNLHLITETKSWQAQRIYSWGTNTKGGKCKSLADSSLFINKDVFDSGGSWIGFVREVTTTRSADAAGKPGKCFTVSFKEVDNHLITTVSNCATQKAFICEIFPVNCSEQFGDFTDGNFSTPNYPQSYKPRMHCTWTIFLPDDQSMTLQIRMDIEDSPFCQYDFVKIYFGASTNDSYNETLCGKQERVFYNVNTNVTIQFLSDETLQSSGIFVSWTFVPNTTTTTITSAVTTTLKPFTESYQGDMDENKIELSVASLAGLIAGIVLLVVLACIAGFLCGHRRRTSPSNDKEGGVENETDRIDNKAVSVPTQNNENIESEYTFTNAMFETSAPNALSPKSGDVERINASSDKRVSDNPSEISDISALYSQVDKAKKQNCITQPKKPSVAKDTGSKQTKIPEELYNTLSEKDENMYANKTENIYNHFDDTEPNYDDATSPRDTHKRVAPDLETYDSKK